MLQDTREVAQGALDRLTPKLGKVRAACNEPCQLVVDGGLVSAQAVSSREFFIATGQHTVEAQWAGRPSVSKRVDGVAGARAKSP